jgi:hypothetical protein
VAGRNRPHVLLLGALAMLAMLGCGSDDGGGSGPPRIDVVFTASQTPFAHADGSAAQTAARRSAGIRSLTLIDDSGEPWQVVERGTSPAFVRLDPGARNVIDVVMAKQVVAGHYTRARLVQAWSRFEIAATLHTEDGSTEGTLAALVVTSDGTLIDGKLTAAGYYVYAFSDGETTATLSGGDAHLPEHARPGAAEIRFEDGEYAAYFPIDLRIGSGDGVLTIDVDTFEAARWTDVSGGVNLPGVYDLSPPLHEPFVQLVGDRFEATFRKR